MVSLANCPEVAKSRSSIRLKAPFPRSAKENRVTPQAIHSVAGAPSTSAPHHSGKSPRIGLWRRVPTAVLKWLSRYADGQSSQEDLGWLKMDY